MSDPSTGTMRGAGSGRPLRLEHPLPAGMRDLLPEQAHERAALAQRLMTAFELYGYQSVVLPAFEHAEVLERGLGSLDSNEVLQFVEPDTGEVVALRPDMTPQVARLLVTRLADAPGPARLCYQGSVLRRRRARARRHRQIPQAGIELLGSHAPEGDLEVVRVASAAARAAGLDRFVLDVGHVGIARALLDGVPADAQGELIEALALKDPLVLAARAKASGLGGRTVAALAELPTLHGGGEIWTRAERVLSETAAAAPLAEVRQLWEAASSAGLATDVVADLGETWNFEYYTGMTFQLLAEGPGEAVGAGGRYDGLLARYGVPRPAAGMALDLDNLGWALRHAGRVERRSCRVLVAAPSLEALAVCEQLRRRGVACAPNATNVALEHAKAWQYTHLLHLEGAVASLTDIVRNSTREVSDPEPVHCAALVAALLQSWEALDVAD
jgi:ATP phosphoribosyltransferase regulatory subunit